MEMFKTGFCCCLPIWIKLLVNFTVSKLVYTDTHTPWMSRKHCTFDTKPKRKLTQRDRICFPEVLLSHQT